MVLQALPGAEDGGWTPRLHTDRSGLERTSDLLNGKLEPSVERHFQQGNVAALNLHRFDSQSPPVHISDGIFHTADNIGRGNDRA